MTALRDDWLDAFGRAFAHVPLVVYDEDLKPAEVALGEIAAEMQRLREALANVYVSGGVPGYVRRNVDAALASPR